MTFIGLMDEARIRFGTKFGPHYAIMPRSEVEGKFSDYLRDALSIECIEYDVDERREAGYETRVVGILRDLAGKVATLSHETHKARIENFPITQKQAAQFVINDTVGLTGSIRGEVCMISSDINPELSRVAVVSSNEASANDLPPLGPDSVIHTAFLQSSALSGRDYIYIEDVSHATEELRGAGYLNAHYLRCDSAVKSELAYPIIADGRRVGSKLGI